MSLISLEQVQENYLTYFAKIALKIFQYFYEYF